MHRHAACVCVCVCVWLQVKGGYTGLASGATVRVIVEIIRRRIYICVVTSACVLNKIIHHLMHAYYALVQCSVQ